MKRVLVVGKRKNAADMLRKHLLPYGITEVLHFDSRSGFDSAPADIDGVILIHNNSSATLDACASNLAESRSIPIARVRHQWSRAKSVLDTHGFLTAPPKTSPPLDTESALKRGIEFILNSRKAGRVPKLQEVEAKLQVEFSSRYHLDTTEYTEMCNRAAALQFSPQTANVLAPKAAQKSRKSAAKKSPPKKAGQSDPFEDRARAIDPKTGMVEKVKSRCLSTPWLILNQAALRDETVGSGSIWSDAEVDDILREGISQAKVVWEDTGPRYRATQRFLRHLFRTLYAQGRKVPLHADVVKQCKAIFPTGPAWSGVKEIRGEVIGAWAADNLLGISEAHRCYREVCTEKGLEPLNRKGFTALLESNSIRSVTTDSPRRGWEWTTTKVAIQNFCDAELERALEPAIEEPVEPPVEEPVEEETPPHQVTEEDDIAPPPVGKSGPSAPSGFSEGDRQSLQKVASAVLFSADGLVALTDALAAHSAGQVKARAEENEAVLTAIREDRAQINDLLEEVMKQRTQMMQVLAEWMVGFTEYKEANDKRHQDLLEALEKAQVAQPILHVVEKVEAAPEPAQPLTQPTVEAGTAPLSIGELVLTDGSRIRVNARSLLNVDRVTIQGDVVFDLIEEG